MAVCTGKSIKTSEWIEKWIRFLTLSSERHKANFTPRGTAWRQNLELLIGSNISCLLFLWLLPFKLSADGSQLLYLLPVINMFDQEWMKRFMRGQWPSEQTPPSHMLCVFLVFPFRGCPVYNLIFLFHHKLVFKLDPPVDLHEGQREEPDFTSGVFKTSWRETQICFLSIAEDSGFSHIWNFTNGAAARRAGRDLPEVQKGSIQDSAFQRTCFCWVSWLHWKNTSHQFSLPVSYKVFLQNYPPIDPPPKTVAFTFSCWSDQINAPPDSLHDAKVPQRRLVALWLGTTENMSGHTDYRFTNDELNQRICSCCYYSYHQWRLNASQPLRLSPRS